MLTIEEKSAFWMKGITLLKAAGNPYLTLGRTQKEVRCAPITIDVDSLSKKMWLSTTLSPLPGENYIFKGAFKRLGKRSLPFSFEITTEAAQTAFPDPLQYLGFFCNALIPEVEPLSKLLEKKARIANALLPQGEYNQIAKKQLEQKKALFTEHRAELLTLHQRLLQHLIKDPQIDSLTLEQLAHLYRKFAHHFIENPETSPAPFENQLLMQFGHALGAPCQAILMQHLYELTDFEKKLQSLLYRQLLTFFQELEEKKELTLDWIKWQMEAEIALFTTPFSDELTEKALHICESLREYFHRFQTRDKITG